MLRFAFLLTKQLIDKDQAATKAEHQGNPKQYCKFEGKYIRKTLSKESGSTLEEWTGLASSLGSCILPGPDGTEIWKFI